jgi:two-component system, cell cycle sensor histidine kinase and response regulator CckA
VHDFNNALGAIAMATELAASDKIDTQELTTRLRQIVATGQRFNEQLLSFSKDEPDPAGSACELGLVIDDLMPMLRTAAGARAIVSFQVTTPRAAVAIGRSQAEQVLLNLVLNARDAIAHQGTIQIVLRDSNVADAEPPQSVALSVIDNGAGMDEATRSRVLEPYFTTKARGTGLGLSTVFGIVRRAGGLLRVESEPGHGTGVHIWLPRHRSG